ncbi:MAG: hypothetical protein MUP90_17215 [Gammaproteobacteria bacterium]|nr:hypothetical protein [Gammaproteobacteria bacterium]
MRLANRLEKVEVWKTANKEAISKSGKEKYLILRNDPVRWAAYIKKKREDSKAKRLAIRLASPPKPPRTPRDQKPSPYRHRAYDPVKARRRYLNHKEEFIKKAAIWKANNPEKVALSDKKYRASHRAHQRERERHNRRTNVSFRILANLRSRLYLALAGKAASDHTKRLLGCSVDFLKDHLASKFMPGMSFDNYGVKGWHIDHVTPCAAFDLTNSDEQMRCFHFSNLQPLWAMDNHRKGARILLP